MLFNSQLLRMHPPTHPDFAREFDAHVYFEPSTRDLALALRTQAAQEFTNAAVFVGELIDRPVGPHPKPMLEINFPRLWHDRVVAWLAQNRGPLTVLVHQVSTDDSRDHTEGVRWLGDPLSLDLSRFG